MEMATDERMAMDDDGDGRQWMMMEMDGNGQQWMTMKMDVNGNSDG